MGVLSGIEPQLVMDYFETLCAIPHGSHNTRAISDYLKAEAARLGLSCRQDELNNIVIVKEASEGYEDAPGVILQGHMDMVCEKDEDVCFDFEKDGLKLVVEDDFLRAEGTTLGGDDGIAVAVALAVLADNSLPHPHLEAVFTVDEEVGMDGAAGLDCSDLSGRLLLNMDSEGEGVFLAGCAGGAGAAIRLPLYREKAEGKRATLALGGLRGGHSGVEIHHGRANANVMMGRLLDVLLSTGLVRLIDVAGGGKDNAIPRSCTAHILIDEEKKDEVEAAVRSAEAVFRHEYQAVDPELNIVFAPGNSAEAKPETVSSVVREMPGRLGGPARRGFFKPPVSMFKTNLDVADCLDTLSAGRLITALTGLPNGVQNMDSFIPGLVETSLNLGILSCTETEAVLSFSVRSSVISRKDALLRRLQLLAASLGGSFEVSGAYPAWQYLPESRLRDLMVEIYSGMFGKTPTVETIHAGVECGLLSDKMPGLDAVSFGPDIYDIHTPKERMSLSSVARLYAFVCEILRRSRELKKAE